MIPRSIHTLLALTATLTLGAAATAADATSAATAGNYARSGYAAQVVDGRLYVFKEGAPELAAFQKTGQLDKVVMRIHGGPDKMTIKAPDQATLDGYLKAYGQQ